MGALRTVVATVLGLGFVSALALRPLLSNPAIAAAFEDGLFTWETLLGVPLLVAVLALVGYRLRRMTGTDSDHPDWNASPPEHTPDRRFERQHDESTSGVDAATTTHSADDTDSGPSFLSGHGGTREREFEYEEKPPEADLSHHLDHLRAELDDETHRTELESMEDMVEDLEDDRTLPDQCPHEHCDTAWNERGIIRDGSRNYEVLDDGKTVLCLRCERTTSLEQT